MRGRAQSRERGIVGGYVFEQYKFSSVHMRIDQSINRASVARVTSESFCACMICGVYVCIETSA